MKYLYGDATESPLDINYLDFLRDGVDFCASVMMAQDAITRERNRGQELQSAAKVEREQLESVHRDIDRALAESKSRVTTPSAKGCVDSIRGVAMAEIKRSDSSIQGRVTAELGRINEAIAREQANNVRRLEALLLKHDLPGCALWVNARWNPKSQSYIAELIGKAASDVAFVIDLEVPTSHAFGEPVRVERLAPGMTIRVPETSGWVRKSVKMKPHKLAKEYVVAVSHSTKRTTIKLRDALTEPDAAGYDIIYGSRSRVAVCRVVKGAESEPFEPDVADKKALLTLFEDVNRSLSELKGHRRTLRGAQLDSTPVAEHADATVLVRRLITQIAPMVQEISKHSLSPFELVLKRVLADDRREEIFLPKADLRSKLDQLPPELRAVFAPLGLDALPPDITGPPPPIRAVATQVMEDPRSSRPTAETPAPRSIAETRPTVETPPPRPPATTLPEPATQRRVPDTQPETRAVDEEETSVQEKSDLISLPHIEDVASHDEALPLPLSHSAVIAEVPRPGAGNTIPAGAPPQLTPMPRGVSMPSARKPRSRAAPPVPQAPVSNRTALPKPSSPPKRGVAKVDAGASPDDEKSGPGLDVHAHDSVDIQLDELLKPE